MQLTGSIFVAGHTGLVGSAIVRRLLSAGYRNLLLRQSSELDLTMQKDVENFFQETKPAYVVLAAAKVGGILANSNSPADFIRDNLAIQTNVIHAAWKNGATKLLFLGSSCIYPRDCEQPIKESSLLTGPLEPSNEWYAVAKIAGIKMCQAYRRQYAFDAICAMPTNLYGPGDNFHPDKSHVLPGLIRRLHEAKENRQRSVSIWGTGTPRREFLFVDDLADACLLLLQTYSSEDIINIGVGTDLSIFEAARLVAEVIGYRGEIKADPKMPDGTPRKLLDVRRIQALGWSATTALRDGIAITYRHYLEHELARNSDQ